MGAMIIGIKNLVGNPEGKRLPGRHSRRWEGHIVLDFREITLEYVEWMQGIVTVPCEYGNDPSGCIRRGEFLD
jgi:hypothetical protein